MMSVSHSRSGRGTSRESQNLVSNMGVLNVTWWDCGKIVKNVAANYG